MLLIASCLGLSKPWVPCPRLRIPFERRTCSRRHRDPQLVDEPSHRDAVAGDTSVTSTSTPSRGSSTLPRRRSPVRGTYRSFGRISLARMAGSLPTAKLARVAGHLAPGLLRCRLRARACVCSHAPERSSRRGRHSAHLVERAFELNTGVLALRSRRHAFRSMTSDVFDRS